VKNKSEKILVTGGAGYIGSHMVLKLLEANYQPIIVDNLSTGLKHFVPHGVPLYVFNIGEKAKLSHLLAMEKFDAVMHFAASTEVNESIKKPEKYYQNNFGNTLNLLEVMSEYNLKNCIFSSTAAIFGESEHGTVHESHPKNPMNPYGYSKLMCERLLQDFDKAYGIKSVCLRYFNAAGADIHGRTGYQTHRVSHLIPITLQAARGKRKQIEVFGRDYPTLDGTCIRDYIHVMDLCNAHLLALNYLMSGGDSRQYNLGNGKGYSVQQIIDITKKVTNMDFEIFDAPRRLGDTAKMISDTRLVRQELGWEPCYSEIETIIQHAWQWEKAANI